MNRIVPKIWGREEWLIFNSKYVVKKLIIEPKQNISLQYHQFKDEFWYVLEGSGTSYLEGEKMIIEAGDYLHIKPGNIHTVQASDEKLIILETSTSQVDDVVRISREVDWSCL